MTRNLRSLCLALIVAVVVAGMASSAASAATFNSEGTPTALTGTQFGEEEFIVSGQAVKCKKVTSSGSITGTSVTSMTMIPTFSECTYGGILVHVTVSSGCTLNYSAVTNAEGHGKVKIACTGGPISITYTELDGAGTDCTLTIASQEPNGGASYTNEGSATTRDVKIRATITGITTTADPTGSPQSKCNALAVGKAKYEGLTTVRGYVGGAAHVEANHRGIFYA